MGRTRRLPDMLIGYHEFLTQKGRTRGTANVYLSAMYQFWKKAPEINTSEDLTTYYTTLTNNTSIHFQAAWNHFVEFASYRGEVFPKFKEEEEKASISPPPFGPLLLICDLNSYKLTQLIDRIMEEDYVWDPERRRDHIRWGPSTGFSGASRVRAVKLIVHWAYPNGFKPNWPLLPREPCTSLTGTPKKLLPGIAKLWTFKMNGISLAVDLEAEADKLYLQAFGSLSLSSNSAPTILNPASSITTSDPPR